MGFVLNLQCKVNVSQNIMLVGFIALGDKPVEILDKKNIENILPVCLEN